MKVEEFITDSFEKTRLLGETFAQQVKDGGIIALYGELGGGKTTFVQGLAKGLGIERRIISPTFVIVRTYKLKLQNAKAFYHIDLYRTESKNDIDGLGIGEIMNDPKNIVAIEWAEKMKSLLPERRIDIHFDYTDENKRKITIKNKQ